MDMLFKESIADSSGTIRFYYQAIAVFDALSKQYTPQFDLEKQERWDLFPYSEWAVQSYYNFKKFNQILNYGMGYKNALQALTENYVKNFGVSREQAFNTALYTLQIPSIEKGKMASPDNLYYMLLTGEPWEKIEKNHTEITNFQKLLKFGIAFPENLQKLISKGETEPAFDIDFPNWFGKTPLMLAAQYGYLDSIKLLLEKGTDINKQTFETDCWDYEKRLCISNGKRSALMYAAQEGQYETVKFLLKNGADISSRDTKGMSAYEYMLGTALFYDPQKLMTINGGNATPYEYDEKNKSPFSPEQVKELTPLLQMAN